MSCGLPCIEGSWRAVLDRLAKQASSALLADHKDLVKLLLRSQELVDELGRPGVDARATVTELQVSWFESDRLRRFK